MDSIPACHAGDRGSIPRRGVNTVFLNPNFVEQTGAEARLVCNTQTITMTEGEGSKTLGKEGETVSGSIFLDTVTRGYGLRLRISREEDEMTISNTLTVRSGRFLTAPSIRWTRLYMSAHSYDVAFHCILINTWLNQKRMSLLITQDKKTQQDPQRYWTSDEA